ncbi:MAG: polysaccharide biosynthesis protein [Eubacteriales bacterium]|nr:polysaccharide biosynthesis protein [Eubacteriales bacterium]
MKQKSATGGFAVLSAAGLIVKLMSILYVPVILAILGEEGNGVYAAAYQVYVFVYILTNSGIPSAISKLVSELTVLKKHRDALRSFRIARALLIVAGLAAALLMAAAARPLAAALNFNKAYLAILTLSPAILFTSIASSYRGYFQGHGNMLPTAVSQVLEQVVHMTFTVILAGIFLKYGLEAACAGGAAGTSIGALFSVGFLIIYFKKNPSVSLKKADTKYAASDSTTPDILDLTDTAKNNQGYGRLLSRLMNYGIPITLCMGLQYAGNLVDLWNTKSRLLAAGFAEGHATMLYSYLYKYQQLMNAPISVVSALSAVVLPAVAAAAALKNRDLIEERARYAFRLCMMIVLPSAAGLAVMSRQIYLLLRFGEGHRMMLYGAAVLVLMSLVQIQTVILQAAGKLYTATFHLLLGIILKITVNYFLISIPELNIMGAIIGSLAGYLLPIMLNLFVLRNKLKIRTGIFENSYKPFISSVSMSVTVYLTGIVTAAVINKFNGGYLPDSAATLVSITAGMLFYLYLMAYIGGIKKDDLSKMPPRMRRFLPAHFNRMLR